jgi:hypothetical protein
VDSARASVEDAPELKVCERNVRETLAVLGSWAIELLPRTSSGGCGIGRRRRSVRRRGGLPHRGRGGQVTGPPGSEEPADRPGASPVPVTAVNCRATDLCRGTVGHHLKGPCSSYLRGPFAYFADPAQVDVSWRRPGTSRRSLASNFCRLGGVRRQCVPGQPTGDWSALTGLDHLSPGGDVRCGRGGPSCGRRGPDLWTTLRKTHDPKIGGRNPCRRCR